MTRKDFSHSLEMTNKKNGGPVISNPFGILRVNSVRDLSELNHERAGQEKKNGSVEVVTGLSALGGSIRRGADSRETVILCF
jgi:hypothetical protein